MDLDLTRVLELALELLDDLVRDDHHLLVVDLLRLHRYADFSARLDGVSLVDTREAVGDLLDLLEPLDVVLEVLASRSGSRRGDGVRRLYDDSRYGLRAPRSRG